MGTLEFYLLFAGSYLLGSLPVGYWLVRLAKGVDVRQYGSGNIGTVNVSRVAGRKVAGMVLLLDIAKGTLPVLLAKSLAELPGDPTEYWRVAAIGLAPVIGHNWSLFLQGRGGKGVATTAGALLALAPVPTLLVGLIWVLTVLVSRYSSLASILAALSAPVFYAIFRQPTAYIGFAIVAAILVVWRHQSNIRRLLAGTELRIDQKAEKRG